MFSYSDVIEQLQQLPPTHLRFFTATELFWEELKPLGNLFLEMGVGAGDTIDEAKEKGLRWVGLDIRISPELALKGVQFGDATDFPKHFFDVVLCCRPDHSGWAEPALIDALNQGKVAIYVGLERNIRRDLDELLDDDLYGCRIVEDVGIEGERMMIFSRKEAA